MLKKDFFEKKNVLYSSAAGALLFFFIVIFVFLLNSSALAREKIISSGMLLAQASPSPQVCGNGTREPPEECDKGAADNGKVCEAGYQEIDESPKTCSYCSLTCGDKTVRGPYCGDGIKNGNFDADSFRRGDANRDGVVDISDSVFLNSYLLGEPNIVSKADTIDCFDAMDVDDSGEVNASDRDYILNWLFSGGSPPPPAPGPFSQGSDPTGDFLSCKLIIREECDKDDGVLAGKICTSSCKLVDVDPCEIIITKDYTLANDIHCIGDGLYVGASGKASDPLTIDCNGHIISGSGKANSKGISNKGGKYDHVTIQNCTVENFGYGIWVDEGSFWKLLSNNFLINGYGGYLRFNNAEIENNKFSQNQKAGLYMEGSGLNNFHAVTNNFFEINGRWGLILHKIRVSDFVKNIISNNGQNDSPACASAVSPENGCSPGLYLNQAYNNFFNDNTINNNSGDNVYLDSTNLPDLDGTCAKGTPQETTNNYFFNNKMNKSIRGSGVRFDSNSSCPVKKPKMAEIGFVRKNYIGYSSGSDDPGVVRQPPLRVTGLNEIKQNPQGGMRIESHPVDIPGVQTIVDNEIYSNNIDGNSQYGVYVSTAYSDGNILHTNTISQNYSGSEGAGVIIEGQGKAIVRGNSITDNFVYGVKVIQAPAIISSGNTISSIGIGHKTAIHLENATGARIENNILSIFSQYGIFGKGSLNVEVQGNLLSQGAGKSIGLAIIDSEQWKVGTVTPNQIYNMGAPSSESRYLFVGLDEYLPLPGLYPYPDSSKYQRYYNHTIAETNVTGEAYPPTRPVYYFYNVTNTTKTIGDTHHLQVIGGSGLVLDGGDRVLSGADPVEILFYADGAGKSGGIKNMTLSSCRGPCLILQNVSGYSKSSPYDIRNLTLRNARQSGIIARYSQALSLTGITTGSGALQNNQSDSSENGDVYFYNTSNSSVVSNAFNYSGAGRLKNQYGLWVGLNSQNNTIYNNNFGAGSGAFEASPGLLTKNYTSGTGLEVNDGMCFVESPNTGFCDVNCVNNVDSDCPKIQPPNDCASTSQNCCLDILDGVDDADCVPGADPDYGKNRGITEIKNDGVCVGKSGVSDSLCDPNCTLAGDVDCVCTSSPGDCCDISLNGACDYDCPRGFDPDCSTRNNNWCGTLDDMSDNNKFDSISNIAPNFYEDIILFDGGGGMPNAALYCYEPKVKIISMTQGANPLYLPRAYRDMALGDCQGQDERCRYPYRFYTKLRFADLRGLSLRAQLLTSPDGSNFQGTSEFYTFPNPKIYPGDQGYPLKFPEVDNGGDYALGSVGRQRRILTESFLRNSYPFSLDWKIPLKEITTVDVDWDSYRNTNLSSRKGSTGNFYARLQAVNLKDKTGFRENPPSDKEFSYDLEPPSGNLSLSFVTETDPKLPRKYTATWVSVTEPNWTAGKAHYEIWYGLDTHEVAQRKDIDGNPVNGPYVWDDIGNSIGLGAFYENAAGVGDQISYDSKMKDISAKTTNFTTHLDLSQGSINVCAIDDYANENCGLNPPSAWVQTKYGNIYSGGNVGEASDIVNPRYVGTFLIHAKGGISGLWFSSCQDILQECMKTSFEDLDFPKKGNAYATPAGSLDYLNHADFKVVASDLNKRYGSQNVVPITNQEKILSPLGGKIYIRDGPLKISGSPVTFAAGGGSTSGAGLIIVNGDLTIDTDIKYGSGETRLINTASVVWIVLGDIYINKNVENVSGVYIALGKLESPSCPAVTSSSKECGRISTGDSAKQLNIKGLLMAKQFYFQRTYTGLTQGSEVITYDGRLQANTPLGVEDFAKNLPIWKK